MSERVPSPSVAAPTSGRATPDRWTAAAYSAWGRYGGMLLAVIAVHAAVTAALRWNGALVAFVLTPDAPTDLLIRTDEVRRWFSGVTIYNDAHSANYPPASYTLLWPLVGWVPELPTRVLYAVSILASLAVIAAVSVRASGATTIVAAVAALVARLWIHHRSFGDVLLAIPATALFRITKTSHAGPGQRPISAALLLAAMYGLAHAPWSWLSGQSQARRLTAEVGRTAVWLEALAFLLQQAPRSMKAA